MSRAGSGARKKISKAEPTGFGGPTPGNEGTLPRVPQLCRGRAVQETRHLGSLGW